MKESYREAVSGFTHLIGALLALIGVIWLVELTFHDLPKLITVIIFGMSVILLYLASTAMHLFNSYFGEQHHIARLLQKLDHAAIYLMIAGGYTPFAYHLLLNEWRWIILGVVWGLAIIGVVMKLFFFFSGYVSTFFYLVMGWLGVIVAPDMLQLLDVNALKLLVGGGIIYTIGAIIYALKKPDLHLHFGHHELWHLFVMAGTACHFAALSLSII